MKNESLIITPNNENKEGSPPTIGLKISKLTDIDRLRAIIIGAMDKIKDKNTADTKEITGIEKIKEYTSSFFSKNKGIKEINKADSLIRLVERMYVEAKKFATTTNGTQKPTDHLSENFFPKKAYDSLLFLLICLIHMDRYNQEILNTIKEKCQFQMEVAHFDEIVNLLLKARYNHGKSKVLDESKDAARKTQPTKEFEKFVKEMQLVSSSVTALLFSAKAEKVNEAKELLEAFYFRDFFDDKSKMINVVTDSEYTIAAENLRSQYFI